MHGKKSIHYIIRINNVVNITLHPYRNHKTGFATDTQSCGRPLRLQSQHWGAPLCEMSGSTVLRFPWRTFHVVRTCNLERIIQLHAQTNHGDVVCLKLEVLLLLWQQYGSLMLKTLYQGLVSHLVAAWCHTVPKPGVTLYRGLVSHCTSAWCHTVPRPGVTLYRSLVLLLGLIHAVALLKRL